MKEIVEEVNKERIELRH